MFKMTQEMEKIIDNERRAIGFVEVDTTKPPYSNFKPSEEWMMGYKPSLDVEEEWKRTIERLVKLTEKGLSQKKCLSLNKCSYIKEGMDLGEMSSLQAFEYLTIICKKYPGACGLNLTN